jgi:signal transduction histidine kinase
MSPRRRLDPARLLTLRRPPRLGKAASLCVAVIATGAAAVAELQARGFAERAPFTMFFLAVFVSGWLGGLLAGFVAIAASAVVVNVVFLAPAGVLCSPAIRLTGIFLVVATAIHLSLVTLRSAWMAQDELLDQARRRSEELAAAMRARDEFLAVAGHELNTPLAALHLQLQGLARLVGRRPLGFEALVDERLERSIGHVERLESLVEQLLDASRLAATRLVLTPEPLDFANVVGAVVERMAGPAARAGTPIRLASEPSLPGRFDRRRLDQLATHLISNAVKYGMGQPVDVEVRRDGDAARLVVRDRGIGLDPSHGARIFERFGRAASDRHYGGLGLGLWVVRRIVDAAGGTVGVESAPGSGATFTVRLPLDA